MNPDTWTAVPVTNHLGWRVDSSAGTAAEVENNPWRSQPKFALIATPRIEGPWEKYQEGHRQEGLGNSTAPQELPEDIDQKIEALFEAAKEEDFEDGMESEFSKKLVFLLKRYGDAAMEALTYLIIYERVNAEVASEALRWLGRINHPASYHYRLWLLERSLRCSSAMVRDGATLGLASLDDHHTVTYLKQAIQQEPCKELRRDMEQVLIQLLEKVD